MKTCLKALLLLLPGLAVEPAVVLAGTGPEGLENTILHRVDGMVVREGGEIAEEAVRLE